MAWSLPVSEKRSQSFLVPQSGEKSEIWSDYQSLIKQTNMGISIMANTNIANGDSQNFF